MLSQNLDFLGLLPTAHSLLPLRFPSKFVLLLCYTVPALDAHGCEQSASKLVLPEVLRLTSQRNSQA
jgi:hypothetical protein